MLTQTPTPSYISTPTALPALPPAERPSGAEASTAPAGRREAKRSRGSSPDDFHCNTAFSDLPPLEETAGAARRFIAAVGRRVAREGDVASAAYIRELEQELKRARKVAVAGLQASGYTNGQIGMHLGVSPQAISQMCPGDGRFKGPAGHQERRRPALAEEACEP